MADLVLHVLHHIPEVQAYILGSINRSNKDKAVCHDRTGDVQKPVRLGNEDQADQGPE